MLLCLKEWCCWEVCIFRQEVQHFFFFWIIKLKLLHQIDKIHQKSLGLYLCLKVAFNQFFQKLLENLLLGIDCDIWEDENVAKNVLAVISMSPYEVIENIESIVLVVENFYYLQKLLQLKILFSRNLRKLNQNSVPNVQPIKFSLL